MTEKVLKRPDVLRILYHPRRGFSFRATDPQVQQVTVNVAPDIDVGGWLYVAGEDAPLILFFHGNGEIAADYDDIATLYTQRGISLLVMDYRGYGASDGTPTGVNQLADAVAIYQAVDDILAKHNLAPSKLYVMGRSMGSASAIEIARHAGNALAGLIIESGFADTFALVARLGGPRIEADDAVEGFGNAAKMADISIPTLVIHGENDVLIPASDGQTLYKRSAAEDKRLLLIPRAGHNDIMLVGMDRYFGAIEAFVDSTE